MMMMPLFLYYGFSKPQFGACVAGVTALLIGASTLWLDHLNGGWYSYYVFEMPRGHGLMKAALLPFWTRDLLTPLPVAVASVALYLVYLAWCKPRDLAYHALAVGMVGAAWASRLRWGGYSNVLIPAHAVIAILFGMALHRVLELCSAEDLRHGPALQSLVYAACLIQLGRMIYDPFHRIPMREDREAGARVVAEISSLRGDVFVPSAGYLARLAGKPPSAHSAALYDVLRGPDGEVREGLVSEITRAFGEKRFAAIVLDSGFGRECSDLKDQIVAWFCRELRANYSIDRSILSNSERFFPVTGVKARPDAVYLPVEDAGAAIQGGDAAPSPPPSSQLTR
jgi:hypothetical protein